MKNLKLFSFLTLITLIGCLYACGPDEEVSDLSITTELSNEYPKVGDTVSVTVNVNSSEVKLTQVTIEGNTVDTLGTDVQLISEDESASELTYTQTFEFVVPASLKSGAEINIVVKAYDKNDESKEAQIKLVVAEYMKLYRTDATMGHKFGHYAGAYDLVVVDAVYIDGANNTKDLKDVSENRKALSQTIEADEASSTTYVDLGIDFDIMTLNDQNVNTVYVNKSNTTIINVVEGTKFLARLRDGSDWAVVHIKTIDNDFKQVPEEDSPGRYIFDVYKTKLE